MASGCTACSPRHRIYLGAWSRSGRQRDPGGDRPRGQQHGLGVALGRARSPQGSGANAALLVITAALSPRRSPAAAASAGADGRRLRRGRVSGRDQDRVRLRRSGAGIERLDVWATVSTRSAGSTRAAHSRNFSRSASIRQRDWRDGPAPAAGRCWPIGPLQSNGHCESTVTAIVGCGSSRPASRPPSRSTVQPSGRLPRDPSLEQGAAGDR